MKTNIANFFWHGDVLSLQANACISSFVANKFQVNVFSYNDKLSIPPGAHFCSASEILPSSSLHKYTQAGIAGNIAAFSDAFRYNLLIKNGGWWFDTDVFCLKDVNSYINLLHDKKIKISLGLEDSDLINGAVLYADDVGVLNNFIKNLYRKGTTFEWGEIGPKLITSTIKEMGYMRYVEPVYTYYPIHYSDYRKLFDPQSFEWCNDKISLSYSVHLWNEWARRERIPKDMLPPEGSFLYHKYISCCPELKKYSAISTEMLQTLFNYSDMQKKYTRLLEKKDRIMKNPVVGNIIRLINYLLKIKN